MRLQLISDLHTEFHFDPTTFCKEQIEIVSDLDFLVIAGDLIVPSRQSEKECRAVLNYFAAKAKHVLYVIGNHEYYGGNQREVENQIQKMLPDNFHWLYNEDITLDGVHFYGGAMWFDYDPMNFYYRRDMNDFSQIAYLDQWVYLHNQAFTVLGFSKVRPETVVISHHLPHSKSTPDRFRGSQINRFFVSNQTQLITEKQPRYWLHGHTHDACAYKLGETQVVCNPYGYPIEHHGKYSVVVLEV